MSSIIALRRSPNPEPSPPRCQRATKLVDHQRRQRFALDVLGDDQEWFAGVAIASRIGIKSFTTLIFFSWIRM